MIKSNLIECEVMLCLDSGDKILKKNFDTEEEADKWVMTFLDNERFAYGGTKVEAWFSDGYKYHKDIV